MAQRQVDSTPMTVLTQSLLDEKNIEIDELTAEIERLNAQFEQLSAAKTQQLDGPSLSVEVLLSSYFLTASLYTFCTAWLRVVMRFLLIVFRCFYYITSCSYTHGARRCKFYLLMFTMYS